MSRVTSCSQTSKMFPPCSFKKRAARCFERRIQTAPGLVPAVPDKDQKKNKPDSNQSLPVESSKSWKSLRSNKRFQIGTHPVVCADGQ